MNTKYMHVCTLLLVLFVYNCCYAQNNDIAVHMKSGAQYQFSPENILEINFISDPNSESDSQDGTIAPEIHNGFQVVDLGLSVKWATCNIGAVKPEDYGDYYYWGSTIYYKQTEYALDVEVMRQKKIIDNNCNLTIEYDTANKLLGGNWRLPTYREGVELFTKCDIEIIFANGVKCYKLTGPNGNSIIMPFAGEVWNNDNPPTDIYGENELFVYQTSTVRRRYDYGLCFYAIDDNPTNYGWNSGILTRRYVIRAVISKK